MPKYLPDTLVRITAPHFTAGIEVTTQVVTRVPPIMRWALHKTMHEVLDYCRRRGYKVEITKLPPEVIH